MANRKDMRREDLIVPYTEPEEKKDASSDIQGTMASTLPMAAIFTRNKYAAANCALWSNADADFCRMIGWTSVIFAVQGWLSETAASKSSQATPAIFSVGMAFLSLGVMRAFGDLLDEWIELVFWALIAFAIRRPGESLSVGIRAALQVATYQYSVGRLSCAVASITVTTFKTFGIEYDMSVCHKVILGLIGALTCIFTMGMMGDLNVVTIIMGLVIGVLIECDPLKDE
ncbi:hypothetical protein LTR56_003047 [Elasticomyces elasticus]|nr:hypothetical protein LTR56_003047 [Elasticomyces elasticus]KAK3662109.1 hypothetical protein LTR22_007082 [Elasticomyces elasticus]KAK4927528.1 hypothetical protein LTR49_005668 [Elasticomyces elasticus]KAK5743698.1 hypothetical protein LTS12_023779 [Elasticomyces elasticus]